MNRMLKGWTWIIGLIVLFQITGPLVAAAKPGASVALILARSGIAAEDNRPALEAATLAVDEINAAGGIFHQPLAIHIIDNQSTPIGSKAAAQKAVDLKVTAVVGAIWSSHCLAMASVLQQAGIPMVTPTASAPAVTLTGNYIFRACFIDSFQGNVMARFAKEDMAAATAGIIINVNEDYSQVLARYFEAAFVAAGGRVPWKGNYSGTAVEFADLLASAAASKVDLFFLPGYARDAGLILKQGRRMGIKNVFLGGDGWGSKIAEYADDALDGCYYSTHWHPDADIPRSRALVRQFRQRFPSSEVNDFRIPLTYDAVMLVADAISRSGNLDRKRVRDALAATKGFEGATGPIAFDVNGDPLNKAAAIVKWEHHRQLFLKTVNP